MITIEIDGIEYYDDTLNQFRSFPAKTVTFEYSLFVIAKWESKWKIPFLTAKFKGADPRLIDFYLIMSKDRSLTPEYINENVANTLSKYINDSQTATTFTAQNDNNSRSTKVYTSEEIYALMFMNHVPLEFEHRNLNRLLAVLRIISIYTNPPKKMTRQEVMSQNAQLNAQRKKEYNTRG